jgi:endonuclease-3
MKNEKARKKRRSPSVKNRVKKIITVLAREFPEVRVTLDHVNPLELLVATILSAQCTDERVNQVTASLFKKYQTAEDYAGADLRELQEDIRPTGFFNNKAKSIQGCCRLIVDKFHGKVPGTMEELVTLPGVGRKTANVILGNAFGIPGVVVDTHVGRISRRLGLTDHKDPVKVEFDLMAVVPQEDWSRFSLLLIRHGRRWCKSRNPLCRKCPIYEFCPSGGDLIKKGLAAA